MPNDPVALLLADEHFDTKIVDRLRLLGYDARTVRQECVDKRGDGFSDEVVLAIAIEQSRAVVTGNHADFKTLHEQKPWHCGIVSCTRLSDRPKSFAKRIDIKIKDRIRLNGTLHGEFVRVIQSS